MGQSPSGSAFAQVFVRQGCPPPPHLFNIFMDFLARQIIQELEEAGVRGFKVAYRQLFGPPTEELCISFSTVRTTWSA